MILKLICPELNSNRNINYIQKENISQKLLIGENFLSTIDKFDR